MYPSPSDLLLSESKVVNRKIAIIVEVEYISPTNNTKRLPCSFLLNIAPGHPFSLSCIDADSSRITVSNGGNIPSKKLRFVCYDKFKNRTAPRVGSTWKVRLGHGPLRSISSVVLVDAEGLATMDYVRAYMGTAVPLDGEKFSQQVLMDWTDSNSSANPSSHQPSCVLEGVIIPGQLPASIAV